LVAATAATAVAMLAGRRGALNKRFVSFGVQSVAFAAGHFYD